MVLKNELFEKMTNENNVSASLTIVDKNEQNLAENQSKSLMVSAKIPKSDKYLSADWLKKILEVCDNVRDKTYIMYHVETGLRVTEVVNSEWVHVDWQNNRTYTYDYKKDQWRYVYWPETVKAALKMWLKHCEMTGTKEKTIFNFSEKTANRIIKHWCKVVNFHYSKEIGSHWLRHTFIRLSRKAHRDIKAVQQNTGDTVKTILEWYSDLSSEDMKYEIEKKPLIQ